jgi:hypothetical protein
MHQSFGNHPIERRGDSQVRLHLSFRLDDRFRGTAGLLTGAASAWMASTCFPLEEFHFRRLLQAFRRLFSRSYVLCARRKLRFRLQPVVLGRLYWTHFRDPSSHFGRAQLD